MDPFKIDLVKRCCIASDNIRDYFLDERYLIDMDQNDMVTPQMLSVTAVDLMLDELSEIGIESNFRAEELLLSPMDLDTLFTLRSKFDKDNFYKFLKNLKPEVYSEFCGVIENVNLPEDLLIEIADFMTAIFPFDTSWEIIQRSLEYWYSTGNLGKHVSALQAKVDVHSDPNTTPITDDNITEISHFLEHMKERDASVSVIVQYITNHVFGLDGVKLDELVKNYDRDKLNPDVLAKFAHYDATHPEEEPDFLVHHHETVYHHLEYWKKMDEAYDQLECKGPYGPDKEQIIMIIVSLILDGFFREELMKELTKFKLYMMDVMWQFAVKIAQFDYEAILRGEIK